MDPTAAAPRPGGEKLNSPAPPDPAAGLDAGREPPGSRALLYVLLGLVAAAIVWSSVSEIDRTVTGRGRLVAPLPNVVVSAFETAVIQSIDVRAGQLVKKGDALVTLDPTFAVADLVATETRLKSAEAKVARLESEAKGAPRLLDAAKDTHAALQADILSERASSYRARLERLDETIARLRAQLEKARADERVSAERRASLLEIEQMQEKLVAENFGAKVKVLEAREKRLEVERDLRLAQQTQAEVARELAAAEADRRGFAREWRQKTLEELVEALRERDALAEQLSKMARRSKLVTLASPVDGVVLEIAKRSVASVVREAEPLVTIVPLDSPLVAELQVASEDIGLVRPGDPVRVKLDAFPYQQYGVVSGKVKLVSADAFVGEGDPAKAIARGGVYYLCQVELGEVALKGVPKDFRLLPGMTLAGEIVVGKRTVISYLLYPVIRTLDSAMRES